MKLTNQYVAGFLEFNGCFIPYREYKKAARFRIRVNFKSDKYLLMQEISKYLAKRRIVIKEYNTKEAYYFEITTKKSLKRFIMYVSEYCKFIKQHQHDCLEWADSKFAKYKHKWKKAEG